VTRLDAARLVTVDADVDKALRGGPFAEVNAVPEGTSCSLEISAAGKPIISVQPSPPRRDGKPGQIRAFPTKSAEVDVKT